MILTGHAERRAIQRAVPREVIFAISAYGSTSHSRGALTLSLDREALALASCELRKKDFIKLERHSDVYIIEDGDSIITVARKARRFRR